MKNKILEIKNALNSERYHNEASISQGILQPLLQKLNWPIFNTEIVYPEYSLDSRRVDFALCNPPKKPIIFIEVKQTGNIDSSAERQLFEYSFHKGVPMAILLDGNEWQFFLPGEQGNYEERRFYKLDLLEREIDEIILRLNRYLEYENVCSGKALDYARKDYKDVARKREAKAYLPEAWNKLIEEKDDLLIELLSDKVESLCGYKPDNDTIIKFLNTDFKQNLNLIVGNNKPKKVIKKSKIENKKANKIVGFILLGKKYETSTVRGFCLNAIREIAKTTDSFYVKYAALPKHGNKRRFIAQNKYDLYPGRKDMAKKSSIEIIKGWWLGVNIGQHQAEKIVKLGCDVAGLKVGKDFKIIYK